MLRLDKQLLQVDKRVPHVDIRVLRVEKMNTTNGEKVLQVTRQE